MSCTPSSDIHVSANKNIMATCLVSVAQNQLLMFNLIMQEDPSYNLHNGAIERMALPEFSGCVNDDFIAPEIQNEKQIVTKWIDIFFLKPMINALSLMLERGFNESDEEADKELKG